MQDLGLQKENFRNIEFDDKFKSYYVNMIVWSIAKSDKNSIVSESAYVRNI